MASIPDLTSGVWNIDPVHSSIEFVARHLMISKVRGKSDYVLHADLTIKGTTKSVDFDLEFDGVSGDPWGGTRAVSPQRQRSIARTGASSGTSLSRPAQ